MQTQTLKLYPYSELKPEAQAAVLERLRHFNVDDYVWYDIIVDDWKEKLAAQGFLNADIHFSGFWSQGDGACFDGSVDVAAWLKASKRIKAYAPLKKHLDGITGTIVKNSYGYHYSHSRTRYVQLEGDVPEALAGVLDALEKEIEDERETLSDTLYKELEQEYEYHISDSAVIESIEANEILFMANGNSNPL